MAHINTGDTSEPLVLSVPSLEDLQEFADRVHPGVGVLLQGYANGEYDYEDTLMMVIGVLIAEFYEVRICEQKKYGECFPVLINIGTL